MAFYLAAKEVWRNKGRYFLFSLVIALIAVLVLFIAALSEGLASVNKEYLEKLDADLFVFQANTERSAAASRIDRSLLNDIRRIDGIAAAGPLGIANADIVFKDNRKPLKITLIGVEANAPGQPQPILGSALILDRGNEIVIDKNIANQRNIHVGDMIILKTTQGTREELFSLRVVGITDSQQYLYSPSAFVPYFTWDRIRPQPVGLSMSQQVISNLILMKLRDPSQSERLKELIERRVNNVEVVDKQKAIESLPGYTAQQNTLNTQQTFTLLIGILVIGGFFQIQMLQKIPLIGVLKAIGTSDLTIAAAVIIQIILVTAIGVLLGGIVTLALSLALGDNIPIVFNGSSVLIALVSLLAIGPLGGLVTVRLAISVEPLIALGLSS